MNFARRPMLLTGFAGCAYAFLYFPIVVLIVYSFNRDGVGGFPPRHLTFDWYRVLFADSAMWSAVENSAIVALAAVVISILIGFPAAYALDRYAFPGKAAFQRLDSAAAYRPRSDHRHLAADACRERRISSELDHRHSWSRDTH